MTSKKEEERNEKIIRGLLKLPPNRRCINCNSSGPQYVCTNFQTFVCMTCSGIHREFTHRVKSVSLSKFTSREVEALQEGGNQRAREIFLKDWDPREKRLPDSSNADKVREFIKSVYVERKYSGTNTSDKPPRDSQNLRNHEDETRRASSYHSYSQSPPYDYQYEERRYGEGRYGKHAPALTKRSGSDRRMYEGRILSFLSPSRLRDHVHEDRLASEGSRASDYSTSSGGDPFRSGIQSPTFPRDSRFSSPSSETSRDILSEDVQQYKANTSSDLKGKSEADQVPHVQRAALSDSFEAFSSKSVSFKSVDSVSKEQVVQPHTVSNFSPSRQSSEPKVSDGLELFSRPFVPQTATSTTSAIDLFQPSDTSSTSSVDFFNPSPPTSMGLASTPQQPQAFPPSSLDLFSTIPHQQSTAILTDRSPDLFIEKNEGWATFDVPQHVEPSQINEASSNVAMRSTDNGSLGNFGQSINSSLQWSYQDSSANGASPSMHNPWIEGPQHFDGSAHATSNQPWSAFDDSAGPIAFHDINKQRSGQDPAQIPSIADQYLVWEVSQSQGIQNNQMGTAFVDSGPPVLIPQLHSIVSADAPSALPFMAAIHEEGVARKSSNPFDLPSEFDNESSNTFLDMSSFQAELPDSQMPTSFISGVSHPWFPQGSGVPYVPTGPQGGLGFMAGQASNTQIPNIPSQGPIGGNPFD